MQVPERLVKIKMCKDRGGGRTGCTRRVEDGRVAEVTGGAVSAGSDDDGGG